MDIARVASRDDLEDFHAVLRVAHEADYTGLPAHPLAHWVPVLDGVERAGARTQLYVGRDRARPVAALELRIPTMDNLAAVTWELTVAPAARRRGHGRQLAAHALAETRALGRTRVFVAVPSWPVRPSPAATLLAEHGFVPVVEDTRRALDLVAHPPAPRPEAARGYSLVQWLDHAPDQLVGGLAYLSGRMTVDAPLGDMDYEPEKWDDARYREKELDAVARGWQRLVTAAVHESGQVAGVTELAVTPEAPAVGEQWDTIVDPDHRGHGLGLVLKRWNHAALVERWPQVRSLNTWNASSNSYMIAVNEALGFRPMETWTEHQLDLQP